ncbi:MAG: AEC family transporter [Neisseriaceae bacterium]|nr:AEC family transporter [Neisseriaceae bacterium]
MWQDFIASFYFAVGITVPNILLLVFGLFLFRTGQIDGHFCHQAAQLMFRWALPALLFFSIVESQLNFLDQIPMLLAGTIAALILFILAEIAAYFFVNKPDRGIFVQGIYRGNTAIVGVAFCTNAYGAEGLSTGAIFTGTLTLLYNILAVITLSRSLNQGKKTEFLPVLMNIIKNPLIIAIVLAFTVRFLSFRLPESIAQGCHSVASLALPLALLCIGATFDVKSVLHKSDLALITSLLRVVISPAVAIAVGYLMGLDGVPFGVLILMHLTPVAAAAYVMVKAMGGNDVIIANIVGITTVVSMITASLWITLLHWYGLM